MEKVNRTSRARCLVLAYPVQGHINPMLQFCKRLQNRGLRVTLVTTKAISNTIYRVSTSSNCIAVETISDGFDEGDHRIQTENIEAYLARFWEVGKETLINLVERLNNSGAECSVSCIIYDAFMPWGLDVAKKFGLVAAAFFTQSCAIVSIYYHVHKKLIQLPLSNYKEDEIVMMPGLPELEPQDFPSLVYDFGSYPAFFDMLVDQYSNIDKADWVFCNSFYDLENEVVDWLAKLWPFRTIGPSMYLDKQLENDRDYGISIFKTNNEASMKWLNEKPKGSVVYVSFGSLVDLGTEQMEELAYGLKGSKCYFLWVVRESEEAKLPKNFTEENSEKGLVVKWCPQLEVLAHEAVGCFVTHCRWNSSLEGLSLGIPMVAMPQRTDQSTNAKYIKDVWKTGVKVPIDEKGIARCKEIEYCIKEVMEGEKGKEIRRNANKWRELAEKAVDEGGSSDKNIEEFVAKLLVQ